MAPSSSPSARWMPFSAPHTLSLSLLHGNLALHTSSLDHISLQPPPHAAHSFNIDSNTSSREMQDSSSSSTSPSDANIRLKLSRSPGAMKIVLFNTTSNFSLFRDLVVKTLLEAAEASALHQNKATLTIAYEDDEGDLITVDTDDDLKLAFIGQKGATCRFNVTFKSQVASQDASQGAVGRKNPQPPCRYFNRGGCNRGSSCKFSHSGSQTNSSPRAAPFGPGLEKERDNWLTWQIAASAAQNISYLSSDDGLEKLSHMLNERGLSNNLLTKIVALLTKYEIRTSLMKEQTNKIYGALAGSAFLGQIHSRIRSIVKPAAKDLQPYVLLSEQLQSRTRDGWKEVPLDELRSVIQDLEEDGALKIELRDTVTRLLEQRDKLRRMNAVAHHSDTCLIGEDFRSISIIPTKEDILSQEVSGKLPVNQIGVRYSTVVEYLETHFRLLREDCIATLREGIHQFRNKSTILDLRVYTGVRLLGIRCGNAGIEYRMSFVPITRKSVDWESSKRLMYGSLLCLSCDSFQNFFWATVANSDPQTLSAGQVDVKVIQQADTRVEAGTDYVMAESSAAYFEAYQHVLKNLQSPEMNNLPFLEHLLSLEPHISEPSYLHHRQSQDMFDLTLAFPDIQEELGTAEIHILQEWPQLNSGLDKSQIAALKHGLTKRLALIQGPPGTGKTFIGLLIVRIMLENLKKETEKAPSRLDQLEFLSLKDRNKSQPEPNKSDARGPILIVCYTNHALDQFLEGVFKTQKNLVRIGGRCKSDQLRECNLQNILRNSAGDRDLGHVAYGAREQQSILNDEICERIRRINLKFVTEEILHGVATEEQIRHLFYEGCDKGTVVQMWLRHGHLTRPVRRRRTAEEQLGHPGQNMYTHLNEDSEDDTQNEDSENGTQKEDSEDDTENVDSENGTQKEDSEDDTEEETSSVLKSESDVDVDEADKKKGGKMMMILHNSEHIASQSNPPGEEGWTQTTRRRRAGGREAHEQVMRFDDDVEGEDAVDPELPLHLLIDYSDVWILSDASKKKLHDYWLMEIRRHAQLQLQQLALDYERACKRREEVENEIKLSRLRRAKVVGMTTSAAARCHDLLSALQPEIIIVEEAAEVLESHVLACLNPHTKHLILIGDHLQLRPSVAVYKLAVKHKLDVSLFERLVSSHVEHVSLQVQRRMSPYISRLISSLYPYLQDHPCVRDHETVKGVQKSLFFFDHKAGEGQSGDAQSKVNLVEANLVVELCLYLLNQGCYSPEDVTILTTYKGQLKEIKQLLSRRFNQKFSLYKFSDVSSADSAAPKAPRVAIVDDYQGEECKIILLSLVRSNQTVGKDGPGKIGFLNIPNRVCVALSRAKMGLYIFGNGELLSSRSSLWKSVTEELRDKGCYGGELVLCCQNHPEVTTKISKYEDFKQAEDGGCSRPCEYQLDCGHACPRRCHPAGGHDRVICPKSCPKSCASCGHPCRRLCHGFRDCPPCTHLISKQLPDCAHLQLVPCSTPAHDTICQHPCPKIQPCGHKCPSICGKPCPAHCIVQVTKTLPCAHLAQLACHQNPNLYICQQPCGQVLSPGCEHICRGTCGACKQGAHHVPCARKCERILPCGDPCNAVCSAVCPPCLRPCWRRCLHSRCSYRCGDACVPCLEPCPWTCKHHTCQLLCHELCTRPRCNEPCSKLLRCKHPCLGLCGEVCPKKCRICQPNDMEIISQMQLKDFDSTDRFIQLIDCGHLFEVSNLDTWMDMESSESGQSTAVKPKQCPQCRIPIMRTLRYGNVVKTKLNEIEEVKMRIIAVERIKMGNDLMRKEDHRAAAEMFADAINQNMSLFDAHFGLGSALYALSQSAQSIRHLRFIVSHCNSFQRSIEKITDPPEPTQHFFHTRAESPSRIQVKLHPVSARAEHSLAAKAILQWAMTLSSLKNFSDAIRLCDIVLEQPRLQNPEHSLAAQIKDHAGKGQAFHLLQTVQNVVGGKWYRCPNGHVYSVGECGRPMEVSQCPDCQANVGGRSHNPEPGNTLL